MGGNFSYQACPSTSAYAYKCSLRVRVFLLRNGPPGGGLVREVVGLPSHYSVCVVVRGCIIGFVTALGYIYTVHVLLS